MNELRRNRSRIGIDDSDFIGVIIEQTERSLNVILVHFVISLLSNLDDYLRDPSRLC